MEWQGPLSFGQSPQPPYLTLILRGEGEGASGQLDTLHKPKELEALKTVIGAEIRQKTV